MGNKDWMVNAACTQYPADLWFPEHGHSAEEAVAICKTQCPVLQECAAFLKTLRPGQCADGVWAGTTPDERKANRRAARIAARIAA